MVQFCEVFDCKNLYRRSSKVSFFPFPHDNPELLEKWIAALGRRNWQPTAKSLICSCHFIANDFEAAGVENGGKKLRDCAVPSVLMSVKVEDRSSPSSEESSKLSNPVPKPMEELQNCEVNACNRGSRRRCMHSYYPFPHANPDLLNKWLEALGRKNWQPTVDSCICSLHFQECDFDLVNDRKVLKNTAVPSIFPSKTDIIDWYTSSSDEPSSKPKTNISDDNTWYVSDCPYYTSSTTDSDFVLNCFDSDLRKDSPVGDGLERVTGNVEMQHLTKKLSILHQDIRRLDKNNGDFDSSSSGTDSEFIHKEFHHPVASTSMDDPFLGKPPENHQTSSQIEDRTLELQKLRKKIKGLQQKVRRRDKTIASLRKTIDYLKTKP